MKHVRTIIDKEWSEVFKNRWVITTMTMLPMLFVAMPLVMLYMTKSSLGVDLPAESAGLPGGFGAACAGMTASECTQIYLLNQFMIMFMMMPLMIPTTIAAYSIVGEKTTRTLEPLLATPITTIELLAGKGLAAVIPGVLISYGAFGIFLVGSLLLGLAPGVISYIFSPIWLLGILVLGPILSIIATIFAIYVSSRVSDPRVAEQLSGSVILPLLLVMFAVLAGKLVIDVKFMLIAIVVCALVAFGMLHLGTLIFDRENILTKWK
ncbi:MAG: ABC transporter permease subunit [Anaerolineaceae bacterium]|jgi:ABC-2 type transport system permease protein